MNFSYNPPEVSALVGLIETYLHWREMSGPDRGYEVYHPSAWGKCLRLMQYQRYEARGLIKGERESHNGKKLRLFENGHVMHERWVRYFEALGVLRGVWECDNPFCQMFKDDGSMGNLRFPDNIEVTDAAYAVKMINETPGRYRPRRHGEQDLQGTFKPMICACGCTHFTYHEVLVEDKELNFRGHCDIVLDFSRFDPKMFDSAVKDGLNNFFQPDDLPKGIVIVDMKTIGTNQFENKVQKYGAHKYYEIQLSLYVHVLKADFGVLWYEEKNAFDQRVFQIPRNQVWWDAIRSQALKMQEMANGPKPLLPPPRPKSKTDMECSGYKGDGACPYKKFCHKAGGIWDDPQLDQKRNDFYGELL